jgi:AraC family transcriptional activator of pobA
MDQTKKDTAEEIILYELGGKNGLDAIPLKNYFTHILCTSGKAEARLENKTYQVQKNDILIGLPMGINDLKRFKNFKALCLCISFDLLSKNNPDLGWGIKAYLFSKENPVVHLSVTDTEKSKANFILLQAKYTDNHHLFQKEVVNLQLQMFVMDMWNIFSREIENRTINQQKGSLFERFLQLVQEHCMKEREVTFYAEKLFITPKYLTEVCNKSSGKPASEWIQNYTTQRLILLLENEKLDFNEIAYSLNFSSPSFFSRYVRKALGVSPSQFRQRPQLNNHSSDV